MSGPRPRGARRAAGLAWLRGREWFDGRLATLGPSYMTYTKWALALDPPPELKAMVCYIRPPDLARAGMIDGAFQLGNLAVWTEMVAHRSRAAWCAAWSG